MKDLKVNGLDVMKIRKIKPSKEVGDILYDLFEKVVNGKLNNVRKILLAALKNN